MNGGTVFGLDFGGFGAGFFLILRLIYLINHCKNSAFRKYGREKF